MQAALDAIVSQMSSWEPTSDLSCFDALPRDERIALPEHFLIVLQSALQVARESDGAFDPSLGALVDLWGFGAMTPAGDPCAQQVADAFAGAGVLHQSCMLADAYATALMVMGPDQGMTFATHSNLAARFVASAEHSYAETLSPAFAEMLE